MKLQSRTTAQKANQLKTINKVIVVHTAKQRTEADDVQATKILVHVEGCMRDCALITFAWSIKLYFVGKLNNVL